MDDDAADEDERALALEQWHRELEASTIRVDRGPAQPEDDSADPLSSLFSKVATLTSITALMHRAQPRVYGVPLDEPDEPLPATRMPCLFVNHGIGPLPLMAQQPSISSILTSYASTLPADQWPSAIVVCSAHWEVEPLTIGTAQFPALIHDYDGFRGAGYKYRYPAPGAPSVGERIRLLCAAAGIPATTDAKRGWDQCVFVPMMLAFPGADVPIVEVSLRRGQDAAAHVALGQALAPLREEGVLIVGSGNSFHNLRYFFADDPQLRQAGVAHSHAFDEWLRALLTDESLTPEARLQALVRWHELAPSAAEAHAEGEAEQLMPLLVVAGAALGGAGDALEGGGAVPSAHPDDPMASFALSTFEFRDRFRVRFRPVVNSSPYQRVHQPVTVRISVVPGSREQCV